MLKTFLARSFSSIVLLQLFCTAIFWKGPVGYSIFALLVILMCIQTMREVGSILKNCEFDIQKDREYDYYSNVNTPESIHTWMRVFDDPDVVYYSPIQEKCCDPEQDINLNTNEVNFDGESLNIIMK